MNMFAAPAETESEPEDLKKWWRPLHLKLGDEVSPPNPRVKVPSPCAHRGHRGHACLLDALNLEEYGWYWFNPDHDDGFGPPPLRGPHEWQPWLRYRAFEWQPWLRCSKKPSRSRSRSRSS